MHRLVRSPLMNAPRSMPPSGSGSVPIPQEIARESFDTGGHRPEPLAGAGNSSVSAVRRGDAPCKRQGDDVARCHAVANPRPVGLEKTLLADALHRRAERSRTFLQSPRLLE